MSKNMLNRTHQARIMVVDDEADVRLLLTREISDRGYEVVAAVDSVQAMEEIGQSDFDVVLTDVRMPGMDGMELTDWIKRTRPDTDVVVMTGYASLESAVTAIHLGAFDYLVKPFGEMDLVTSSIDRAIQKRGLKEDFRWSVEELRASLSLVRNQLLIETHNKKMKEVLSMVDIIKDESGSVLIQGENGTGKEVIASLLHYCGRRHTAPFVAINCAARPETLLESELFGHEKGSFTGATEKRIGKFELAHNGTVFLDEIGDMPVNTQAKILRVLETGEIERVGGHNKIPVELRIVAATNQNIHDKIEQGQFRQDLFFRINTFTLVLPPLRERKEDLLPIAQHFLDEIAVARRGGPRKSLSQTAKRLLSDHDWPGNVRELRNAMEQAEVLAVGSVIGPESLPKEIRDKAARDSSALVYTQPSDSSVSTRSQNPLLKELEGRVIIETLSKLGNNTTAAAKRLGISKASLYRKLKKHGISGYRTFIITDQK